MDLTTFYFLTTMLVLILEQEAFSIDSTDLGSERDSQTEISAQPARREKRCSCENLKDKECVYFCHIGIVWVNTPGQLVPYGVGSFPVRLRRAVRRCACTDGRDSECLQFCTASPLLREQVGTAHHKRMFPSKSREKYKSGTSDKRNRIQEPMQKT